LKNIYKDGGEFNEKQLHRKFERAMKKAGKE